MEGHNPVSKENSTTVCTERYGLSALRREYLQKGKCQHVHEMNKSPKYSNVKQVFNTVFLPQGYPDSVSADYIEYQVWDTVQAFASSVSGTLATHSLLQGMGVGDSTATVLAATFTWILKDGTGMTGRILFAWMKGNQLDCDAKKWRLFADFLNDFAICLEVLAPLTQTYFRWVVCLAGVCKSLVGVAGGATRAALTQHQARRNNMADVSAKDGSQETLVNLLAMLCSLVILPVISGHFVLVWVLFALLTCLHLFANYRAVRAVRMESLNQARLHIIVDRFLRSGEMPGIVEVNGLEPVFGGNQRGWTINLGASFSVVRSNFDNLMQAYDGLNTRYILHVNRQKKRLTVVLSHSSTTEDQLQACVQAELIAFLLNHSASAICADFKNLLEMYSVPDSDSNLMRRSYIGTDKLFPQFLTGLKDKGWRPDLCLLSADEWRASWSFCAAPSSKDD